MTEWRLDHVVISVRDLKAASADYQRLGFTVLPGGTHPGGWTHNALIVLADGTYLELLAPVDVRFLDDADALAAPNFLFALADGEGTAGLALAADDLAGAVTGMRERGAVIDDPRSGGRTRPDGVRLEWKTAMPSRSILPFFIEDVTPRSLRVPADETATIHANGALGIASVTISSGEFSVLSSRFAGFLGEANARNSWELGSVDLQIEQGADWLKHPEISLQLHAAGELRVLDHTLTHGAEIWLGG